MPTGMNGSDYVEPPCPLPSMIHTGDCVEVMATFEAESVSAIVTDPPYGLGFMGKEWDRIGDTGRGARARQERASEVTPVGQGHSTSAGPYLAAGMDSLRSAGKPYQRWCETWVREALRVAKPGAHLLAFGGTRTYHRLASAIEDAGWEIRDCLVWAYASGFPKSLDVSKAIDKAAGHWRGRAGAVTVLEQPAKGTEYERTDKGDPVTAAAAAAGWGTALKPAWEPIVLARKPFRGTVAGNWMEHGTGALNIDATRIPFASEEDREDTAIRNNWGDRMWSGPAAIQVGERPLNVTNDKGRWPANVLLTDPIFDGGVGGVVGGGETDIAWTAPSEDGTYSASSFAIEKAPGYRPAIYGDSGTYSRFFLVPKADRDGREPNDFSRNEGVGALREGREGVGARLNVHPTVKPVDLMRHLVRLVTPQGGLVLDPFLGSGTTAIACELEGFGWIGIEKEAEYVAIAEARLNGTQRGLGLVG